MIDIQNKGPKRLENPKQLCAKNFSLFSFVRHFEGFPRREKSKRELIPKPSLEVPCPLLRLKEKQEERSNFTPLLTTRPGVLIVLVKKKALGSSNFVLFVI